MRKLLPRSLFFAIAWWIVLLPKHFDLLGWLQPFREGVYGLLSFVFGQRPYYEDSSGMYLLLLVAPFFGLLTAGVTFIPAFRNRSFSYGRATRMLVLGFLTLELCEYGWMKLVKSQFYLPEPNTVYTELGALSKDIAYWSVIGSSRPYVVFLGVAELLAGSLLLFRRTRFVGLLLALGIFANVCMVNFAFDISVKLFALSLLGMTAALLAGYPERWRVLFGLPAKQMAAVRTAIVGRRKHWARALFLALMVVETVYPSVIAGSLNDDTSPRTAFHGAYRVTGHSRWKNLYIHRHGYFIFEDRDGRRLDWKVTADNRAVFRLLDERTGKSGKALLKPSGNGFVLVWRNGPYDTLQLQRLPYRKLPLLKPSFHWTSDAYH